MTKEEAREFKERWRLVNEATIEEARNTPPSVKLQQLALMYEAAKRFGWIEKLREGEEEVHERWRLLKERMHV